MWLSSPSMSNFKFEEAVYFHIIAAENVFRNPALIEFVHVHYYAIPFSSGFECNHILKQRQNMNVTQAIKNTA